MVENKIVKNYINGKWQDAKAAENLDVVNPATIEVLERVPLSLSTDVELAANAASDAFESWRRTHPTERDQYLFKLEDLLEEHFETISRMLTMENV